MERTALGLFNKKTTIRTFSTITIKLIQNEPIDILLEPEYYLPPSFNNTKE